MSIALILPCTHALLTAIVWIAFSCLVLTVHRTGYISTSLDSDEVDRELASTHWAYVMLIVFVTCPMDGKHKARECDPYDGSEQCMGAREYKRNSHGAMEQE